MNTLFKLILFLLLYIFFSLCFSSQFTKANSFSKGGISFEGEGSIDSVLQQYERRNVYDTALLIAVQYLSESTVDFREKARVYHKTIKFAVELSDYEKAKNLISEEFFLLKLQEDSSLYIPVYIDQGILNTNMGNYKEAISSYEEAIRIALIFLIEDREKYILHTKSSIAGLYCRMREFEKSIELYRAVIPELLLAGDSLAYFSSLSVMGIAYKSIAEYDSALLIQHYLVDLYQKDSTYLQKLGTAYNNIAVVHRKLENLDSCFYYQKKALEISKVFQRPRKMSVAYHGMGNISFKRGENQLALHYFDSAYQIALAYSLSNIQKNIYQSIAHVNYNMRQYKEAYDAFEVFYSLSDSLNGLQLKAEVKKIEEGYKSKEKDLELAKKNSLLERERVIKLLMIMIAVLLIIIIVLLWKNLKKRKKEISEEKFGHEIAKLLRIGLEHQVGNDMLKLNLLINQLKNLFSSGADVQPNLMELSKHALMMLRKKEKEESTCTKDFLSQKIDDVEFIT